MNKPNLPGIRILSLDGGGMRGVFSAQFLINFCKAANLDPMRLFDYFDIIAGTGIGGLQALAYANGLKPDNFLDLCCDRGFYNLTENKARVVMSSSKDITFYNQNPIAAYIDLILGPDRTLSDLKTNVLIPSWNMTANEPVIFSNIAVNSPLLKNHNSILEVGFATSVAPLYLPAAKIGSNNYLDGSIIQNNPSLLSMLIGKAMFPRTPNIHILSVGTGMGMSKEGGGDLPKTFTHHEGDVNDNNPELNTPYNVRLLYDLIGNVAIEGGQKLNDQLLRLYSEALGYKMNYLRFQCQLPECQLSPMDNSSKEYIDSLIALSNNEIVRRKDDVDAFIKKLLA